MTRVTFDLSAQFGSCLPQDTCPKCPSCFSQCFSGFRAAHNLHIVPLMPHILAPAWTASTKTGGAWNGTKELGGSKPMAPGRSSKDRFQKHRTRTKQLFGAEVWMPDTKETR